MSAPSTPAPGEPVLKPGPKPGKRNTEKLKAQKAIDKKSTPVPLSKVFGGFTPDIRGDVKIYLDSDFTERFVIGMIPMIRNANNVNFLFPNESDAVVAAIRHFGSGLNLAAALKLLQSAPRSELSNLSEFHLLQELTVRVPTTFIEVLTLIGKTDYYDSVLRVANSPYTVRLHLLKAMWLAAKTQSFQVTDWYEKYSSAYLALADLTKLQLTELIFDEHSSIEVLKQRGREYLDPLLKKHFNLTFGDLTVRVSPPYLKENPTKREFVNWMDNLYESFNPTHLATLGIISIWKGSWNSRLNETFGDIDEAFAESTIADVTPQDVLNSVGLKTIESFFPDERFTRAAIDVVTWYSNESYNLQNICEMTDTAKTTFGNAAQMVYVNRNSMVEFKGFYRRALLDPSEENEDGYLDIKVVESDNNMLYCSKKLATTGQILAAGAFAITDKVVTEEKYSGFTTESLQSIANSVTRRAFRLKSN